MARTVLSSLLVVLILGVVVVQVTRWSLADDQPATTGSADHGAAPSSGRTTLPRRRDRAGPTGPDPTQTEPTRTEPTQTEVGQREATRTVGGERSGRRRRRRGDEPSAPVGEVVAVRIPWWRRLRALVGLAVAATVLGALAALLVAGAALALVALLDRALG